MNNDVTAVIIVLNSVTLIRTCLDYLVAQGLSRIIIIDGGSTDGTLDYIKEYDVDLHVIGKTGLAHARQHGINLVCTKYVLLVDSDNRMEKNSVNMMKKYIENSNFCGVAAGKKAFDNNVYSKFQEWMNDKKVNIPGEKLVIGTPSLFYTKTLQMIQYDSKMTKGDDTDLCYRLRLSNQFVGTSDAICYEIMPATLYDFIQKAFLYGEADAQFYLHHKERRLSISTHALRNYLFKMTVHSFLELKPHFFILVLIYSFCRFIGLFASILKYEMKHR